MRERDDERMTPKDPIIDKVRSLQFVVHESEAGPRGGARRTAMTVGQVALVSERVDTNDLILEVTVTDPEAERSSVLDAMEHILKAHYSVVTRCKQRGDKPRFLLFLPGDEP